MAYSNTTLLRVSELDFSQIKQNLRTFLQNQTVFQDYNFEGSALSVLLDVLSYNTFYNSFYLNMVANEMFLDTAVLLNSVISIAKQLNYTPGSMSSSSANVQVIVNPPVGNSIPILTIPAYTPFQSEAINGTNYTFVTTAAYNASLNLQSNTYTFPAVTIQQGEPFTYSFLVTSTNYQQIFNIPQANIDTSTLIVTIQASASDVSTNVFILAPDITTVNADSQVYWLEGGPDGTYSIYFGDDVIGQALSNGNIVQATFLVTDAQNANYANVFAMVSTVGPGYSNITVIPNSQSAGGGPAESIDDIRFRAPLAYTAQNRAVTATDYSVLLPQQYSFISGVAVWGGEDANPPQYGKVFISILPKPGFVVTDTLSQTIIANLQTNQSMMTVVPSIVAPAYVYTLLSGFVYYTQADTTLSAPEMQQLSLNTVSQYIETFLTQFNTPFSVSQMTTLLNDQDPSVISSDLTLRLQIYLDPTLGIPDNYTLDFNAPLLRAGPAQALTVYPTFGIYDSTNTLQTCFMEETPADQTGIYSIQMVTGGIGYTSTPQVVITGDGTGASAAAIVQNQQVTSIQLISSGVGYSTANVQIIDGGGSGAVATAIISQQYNALRTYYYNSSGVKIVLNSNAGIIDYYNGLITLNNFNPIFVSVNPTYPANVITFSIQAEDQTIFPTQNFVYTIDPNNSLAIQITPVPE